MCRGELGESEKERCRTQKLCGHTTLLRHVTESLKKDSWKWAFRIHQRPCRTEEIVPSRPVQWALGPLITCAQDRSKSLSDIFCCSKLSIKHAHLRVSSGAPTTLLLRQKRNRNMHLMSREPMQSFLFRKRLQLFSVLGLLWTTEKKRRKRNRNAKENTFFLEDRQSASVQTKCKQRI